MSKVKNYDFGDALGVVDNQDRFNNDKCRDRLQSCDFIGVVRVAVIETVGVADNRGRFDNNRYENRLFNKGQPEMLYEREDIVISK